MLKVIHAMCFKYAIMMRVIMLNFVAPVKHHWYFFHLFFNKFISEVHSISSNWQKCCSEFSISILSFFQLLIEEEDCDLEARCDFINILCW